MEPSEPSSQVSGILIIPQDGDPRRNWRGNNGLVRGPRRTKTERKGKLEINQTLGLTLPLLFLALRMFLSSMVNLLGWGMSLKRILSLKLWYEGKGKVTSNQVRTMQIKDISKCWQSARGLQRCPGPITFHLGCELRNSGGGGPGGTCQGRYCGNEPRPLFLGAQLLTSGLFPEGRRPRCVPHQVQEAG